MFDTFVGEPTLLPQHSAKKTRQLLQTKLIIYRVTAWCMKTQIMVFSELQIESSPIRIYAMVHAHLQIRGLNT